MNAVLQQLEMTGQLIEGRFIKRPERQNRRRAPRNLCVARIVNNMRGDTTAFGFLLKRFKILCSWRLEAYFLLA